MKIRNHKKLAALTFTLAFLSVGIIICPRLDGIQLTHTDSVIYKTGH